MDDGQTWYYTVEEGNASVHAGKKAFACQNESLILRIVY